MDTILETPVKRRRTETGYVPGNQSHGEYPDGTVDDHETVATLPLPKGTANQDVLCLPSSSYVTQPTQIVKKTDAMNESPSRRISVVQVAASSPTGVSPQRTLPGRPIGGLLARTMAPPGTQFRLPMGTTQAPVGQPLPTKRPNIVDLSDDEGPKYQGSSSDQEFQRSRDIKPTVLKPRSVINTSSSFGNDIAKFRHNPSESNQDIGIYAESVSETGNRNGKITSSKANATIRSGDTMANAYGYSSRAMKAQPRQTGPSRAAPILDMDINEILDFQLRKKVDQMHKILPNYSIRLCHGALLMKRGHEQDALEYLVSKEPGPFEVDLRTDGDETPQLPAPQKITTKQQVSARQTIQEKYAARTGQKVDQSRNKQPVIPSSSPIASPAPLKPRRRLVQGRKQHSPAPPSRNAVVSRKAMPISIDDSDSAIASDAEEDAALQGSLLKFFNTCSVQDLADIAEIADTVAALVLSKKPFKSLDKVRQVTDKEPAKLTGKRKTPSRLIGDKIVDTCERMWTGYQAVDQLVQRCEALGKPIAEEMRKWGVNVYGSSTNGELELVNFNDDSKSESSLRDSGIGTPASTIVSGDEGDGDTLKMKALRPKSVPSFFPQPSIMADGVVLKDYQVVGINWLSLLFGKELSCILADDMGLGKTCQVIAFLAHLHEKGIKGPHVVVVPSSVLENWLREFETFCPTLLVVPYHGHLNERPSLQEHILQSNPDVVITTYTLAKKENDRKFLKELKPCACIFDEGHSLKNSTSEVYRQLMRIPAKFRLLLTGTPLQNNLGELASLLGFILPAIFQEHKEALQAIFSHKAKTTDDGHTALLSAQRIARARSMMTPFILRRKKHQVLKHLPAKLRRVEYCDMTPSQQELYAGEKAKHRKIVKDRAAGVRTGAASTNAMMTLRKAAIHPLLFRRHYDDDKLWKIAKACMAEPQWRESNVKLIHEDLYGTTDMEMHRWTAKYDSTRRFVLRDDEWMDSGKVKRLSQFLTKFKDDGDRVLVFSQFTMVMDILEEVMQTMQMKFSRLDGDLDINLRQDLIDQFYKDESITVFLLSTKAGGAGINLACANKVIIFDSSFNPQDDIQAENRAHRVGQTRDVEVIRLVTRGTIEEQIHALGETKLALDHRVAGEAGEASDKKMESTGKKLVEEMMLQELKKETGTGDKA